jgi:DNA-binding NarL/FixJ family response regulator
MAFADLPPGLQRCLLDTATEHELRVVKLLAAGMSLSATAEALQISRSTVRSRAQRALTKARRHPASAPLSEAAGASSGR